MLQAKMVLGGVQRAVWSVASKRYFHLGHEYAPPARFMSHHAKFALALLTTSIQLTGLTLVYFNADKLRPPPPRQLNPEVEEEIKRLAPYFENGTMSINKF